MDGDRLSVMPLPPMRIHLRTRAPTGNTDDQQLPSGNDTALATGQQLRLSHRNVIPYGAQRVGGTSRHDQAASSSGAKTRRSWSLARCTGQVGIIAFLTASLIAIAQAISVCSVAASPGRLQRKATE